MVIYLLMEGIAMVRWESVLIETVCTTFIYNNLTFLLIKQFHVVKLLQFVCMKMVLFTVLDSIKMGN